jgi:hypothetical protein
MSKHNKSFIVSLVIACLSGAAFGGGPLLVGGPGFGHPGQPFTWDPAAMPIQYRVDPGPLSVSPSNVTVVDNGTGLQRLAGMLSVWQSVTTASVSFVNAGPLLPSGAYTGGDVSTVQQYNAIIGSCNSGVQSPVIFDANAGIMQALGLPSAVIGVTKLCKLDTVNGHIQSAAILMNGAFQDGVRQGTSNFEITANEFDEAFTHEFGHFLGVDHSQINLDLFASDVFPCDSDRLAGLPLMFPVEFCQARKDAGLPVLSPDDVAWISSLYPNAQTPSAYGLITGVIYFSDGKSHFQGANVIARSVDDPTTPADESRRIAFSSVSGYLFTPNPGQPITGDNTAGDPTGSRDPQLIGYYQIPVRPGAYTVEVEAIDSSFVQGSSVGPIAPVLLPGNGPEFWNLNESAFDFPLQRDTVTVQSGQTKSGIDIILNNSRPTFDHEEDGALLLGAPWNAHVVAGRVQ